jgi:alpha-D-glucose phosphate-specific phosphoglucomutase
MEEIKFGTDGWRGVIARDFTFSNVDRVAQAIADYYQTQGGEKGIVVGYDNRFLSPEFAQEVAEILAGNGIPVILSQRSLPTQCISFTVKDRNLAGGVMITASHNPPRFNGIKIKSPFGGSASSEVTDKIEGFLGKDEIKRISLKEGKESGLIREENLIDAYLDKVKSFLDKDLIKKANLKIAYDSMFGVGDGLMERILSISQCRVSLIHSEYNPGFGGLNPEPIEENLEELKAKIKEEKADLGIATDGDADRVGVVDEKGKYLTPHQVFSLLLLYLIEERGMRGGVVKTVSLGYQPERIAKEFGLSLDETPVGFKYVVEKMLKKDVLLGGEESGGYGYRGHLLERDGLLSSLLFVEMITKKQKPLSKILEEMENRFGKSFFKRVDFEQIRVDKKKMVEELSFSPPVCLGGAKVLEVKTIDGIKFIMEDESWLLLRPSGTEPKVRVYAEAPDKGQLNRIIEEGISMVRRTKCMRTC